MVRAYAGSQESADSAEAAHTAPSPQPATYSIAVTVGNGGSMSPGGMVVVNENSNQTFTITPDDGYHVADVKADDQSKGSITSFTFSQVNANQSINVTFAADTYTIFAAVGGNGTIIPAGAVDVMYGESQSFTYTADPGFCVADVRVDGQSIGAVGSYTMENIKRDHSLSVTFFENRLVKVWIEAEDGNLQWPMEIADDGNTGAGGFIWVPSGTGNLFKISDAAGYADTHFDVPQSRDYFIWGRQISVDSASDSFYVTIDGYNEIAWHTQVGDLETWTWDAVSLDSNHPEPFRLAAGSYTMRIKQREDGTKLDRLLIANHPVRSTNLAPRCFLKQAPPRGISFALLLNNHFLSQYRRAMVKVCIWKN